VERVAAKWFSPPAAVIAEYGPWRRRALADDRRERMTRIRKFLLFELDASSQEHWNGNFAGERRVM